MGDVQGVDAGIVTHLLDDDYVPVVCCLAADQSGQILNVNADTVASRIAVEIGAAKYFAVTSVDGVMKNLEDPSTLQSYLDLQQVESLIESRAIGGGMLPKLEGCTFALRGGVPKVHVVNGSSPDALLGEVFTNEGRGTLIVAEKTDSSDTTGAAPA